MVFHSAVLGYVPACEDIDRFASSMASRRGHWLSNESPLVFPDQAAAVRAPAVPGAFLLALDGEPVAFTGPHGQFLHWLG